MKARIICLMLLSHNYILAGEFIPAKEPLSIISQPKPNIFLLIDDSVSMNARDVTVGEHFYSHGNPTCDWSLSRNEWPAILNSEQYRNQAFYDPFATQRYIPYNPEIHKQANGEVYDGSIRVNKCKVESRMNATNRIIFQMLQYYQHRALLGWGTMGGRTPAQNAGTPYPIINQVITDFSLYSESDWNKVAQELNSITSRGWNPTFYALYQINLYFRGYPVFDTKRSNNLYTVKQYAPPDRYRCTTNAIVTFTDGGDGTDYMDLFAKIDINDFSSLDRPNLLVSPSPNANLIQTRVYQLFDDRTHFLNENLKLPRRDELLQVLQKEITPSRSLNVANVDKSGKQWLDQFYKPQKILYSGVTFGQSKFNKPVRDLFIQSGGKMILHGSNTSSDVLFSSLDTIMKDIATERSNGQLLNDGNGFAKGILQYRFTFNTDSRTGSVVAYRKAGDELWESLWSTDTTLNSNTGSFKTMSYKSGSKPIASNLSLSAIAEHYQAGIDLINGDQNILSHRHIQWLKGDVVTNDSVRYEDEKVSLRVTRMGSIVNTEAAHAKKDIEYINVNKLSRSLIEQFTSYIIYKKANQPNDLLVVNANDGLVNFIASGSTIGRAGQRIAAYFPGFLAYKLPSIASMNTAFSYTMDGKVSLYEFKGKNNVFKTIGLSGMGTGGKGLVGYKIFSATYNEITGRFSHADSTIAPLFEINNDGPEKYRTPGFKNLGYTYSDVSFFNQSYSDNSGIQSRGVAVFGNGPGSKVSSIYMIDAETGELLSEVVLNLDGGGALSPALVVEKDASGLQRLSRVYVGDFSGNLYRLQFSNNLQPVVTKIFSIQTAKRSNPITMKPLVWKDRNDYWVYFGTGSILSKEDRGVNSKELQYAIGLKDITNDMKSLDDLLKYDLEYGPELDANVKSLSVSLSSDVKGSLSNGWYIPLQIKGEGRLTGERIISTPSLTSNNDIIFTTWGLNEYSNDLSAYQNDPCIADIPFSKMISLKSRTGGQGTFKFNDQDTAGIAIEGEILGSPVGAHVTQDTEESGEKSNSNVSYLDLGEEPPELPPNAPKDPNCINGESEIMLGTSQGGTFNAIIACQVKHQQLFRQRISLFKVI